MINAEVLKQVLAAYRDAFNKPTAYNKESQWAAERFKWVAVKQFQDNWDLGAEDFEGMLKKATIKHESLLDSMSSYPRSMLVRFAKKDPEAVREMFRNLFDEEKPVGGRIDAFIAEAEKLRLQYGAEEWKNHFQNVNSVSTLLWSRYPDKYYIYKYSECKWVAKLLESDYQAKTGMKGADYPAFLKFYDEIAEYLRGEAATASMVKEALMPECYPDPQLRTLTIDVCYFMKSYYSGSVVGLTDYWPTPEYYPVNISKDEWKRYIQEVEMPDHRGCMRMLKGLMELGGEATCTKMDAVYGGTPSRYVGCVTNIGRRAKNYFKLPPCMEEEQEHYFSIPFLGRNVMENGKKLYSYKIRDELYEALDELDLSGYDPYEHPAEEEEPEMRPNMKPSIWKISEGTESTSFSDEYKPIFLKRNVVVVHSKTPAKANSNTTQGEFFMKHIRNGDFFYLCYGNRGIQLLGCFIGDEATENPELKDGWYERPYRVIAKTVSNAPYSGVDKWWTPNDNSTCIQVDESEQNLFEKLILRPYFGMTLEELFGSESKGDDESCPAFEKYDREQFLQEVFMEEKQYDSLVSLLKHKKNLILQGAPGVGKTFAARRLAWSMMGEKDESRVELIQFHQNYTYEDFIMGYKPDGAGFTLRHGVFYRFCKLAEEHPEQDYFFIIDEINRGNLSKIFGELLMLIEKDYRGTTMTLAYEDTPFTVPKNLYIIGMMNTADRSLAIIDYALRRRFSFYSMQPGFETVGFMAYCTALQNEKLNKLIAEVVRLNRAISEDKSLGDGFCIGHSYFCGHEVGDDDCWLREVVEYDIKPMLDEYWFDDRDTVTKWYDLLKGALND